MVAEQPGELDCSRSGAKASRCEYRVHYRWNQIERHRPAESVDTPLQSRPKVDRTLRLRSDGKSKRRLLAPALRRQAHFSLHAKTYKTIDYNTFTKNGVLKLTEVEMFFLSTRMTKQTSSEWAVVYLGIGHGERFRHLRDEFFPHLTVIAFDPLDAYFDHNRGDIEKQAEAWSNDGTNYIFHVRCFDPESDVHWMRERICGKKLLLISDIRGIFFLPDKSGFDKVLDQEVQWQAIRCLRPERSLVKFTIPDTCSDCYTYAPGVLLKQVFCYYGTCELRLLIDGVPEKPVMYNMSEVYDKMTFHHEHLRGQVYRTTRCLDPISCGGLDHCFDCTVLWETVATYAKQNEEDPHAVLKRILNNEIEECHLRSRSSVVYNLNSGRLTEAVWALQGKEDANEDWSAIADEVDEQQPELAERLRHSLPKPASRADLTRVIGSLSEPFTLLRTELNGLIEYPPWTWTKKRRLDTNPSDKAMWDMSLYKTAPCYFYLTGRCAKGDLCTYKHGDQDVGDQNWLMACQEDRLCWYHFNAGHCGHGSRCQYKHERPEPSN
eukprot:TRINITY_DN42680_c0_g1_i1.p1 TRINITY_DN42680_c0_g1~~TRINITY_DN42680_c0_g1_i1.p1  ORF type:complete len:549 (-),score=70.37 TRINITY_DN42680_c0_g1_i1:37-1683(-)